LIPILVILGTLSIRTNGYSNVVEKVYAVVNGESITYTDLKSTEAQLTAAFSQNFQGEELQKKLIEMRKNLLNQVIEQKVLLSFAKDKNYSNIDGEVEMIIKEMKTRNNIKSDDELKEALASQGLTLEEWKGQLRDDRIQRRFIEDTVGVKIKINNAEIMDYYKKNIKRFTLPLKFSLNCIFLNKSNYSDPSKLQEKKDSIDAELKAGKFEDVAKKNTDLPGGEIVLGEFKEGEMDPVLEKSATVLKNGEHSGWVDTNTGSYILQMAKRTESQLVEYEKVRDDIEFQLRQEQENLLLRDYLQELKKDSYIKIYENWE